MKPAAILLTLLSGLELLLAGLLLRLAR